MRIFFALRLDHREDMNHTIAILGASGYAGGELVRIADEHPGLDVAYLGAHSSAGSRLGDVQPHLWDPERVLGSNDPGAVPDVDLAFLALPHGASWQPAMALHDRGIRVVDLGSDFRMDHPDRYREAYGSPHPAPDELGEWVYGLPELFGDEVRGADRVAAPGCYPTSAVLPLAPLIEDELVSPTGLIVDSLSGVSGAGRGLDRGLLFGTVDESVRAYKVLSHRHQPEMERALEARSAGPVQLIFTPHLVPMQRGILTTIYARVSAGIDASDLVGALDKRYRGAPFVEVMATPPESRWVVGSNRALISVHVDQRSATAVLLCVIDNLLKGAAGQAVQNANLMLGLEETAGLPLAGWTP
jgi:N-acetyl-gamma-glutamyl-phosphate reductase